MYDYKLLEAFTAVVEKGGFEKAAETLFITQSAVSQRVRLLEESLGQILLVRSNPPKPTEAGKGLMAHFNKVRLLESELKQTASQDKGYTPLSIGLNADTLATWFMDAVEETVRKHRILLDLRVDDQEATHQMLRDGTAAGCISTRSKPFQSCTCRRIGTMTYRMLCSSAAYDRFFPAGLSEEALKDVPVIIFNSKDTLHLQMFEKAFGHVPADYPKMFIPAVDQYLDAVMRGLGVGMMPDNQCVHLIKNGKLTDAFAPHKIHTTLYWHRWSISSATLDAISAALIKEHMLI